MDSYHNGFRFGGAVEKEPNIAIFICLCVEILATMIRRNNTIKGISIGETEHKISQYADNTEIMLEGMKNRSK